MIKISNISLRVKKKIHRVLKVRNQFTCSYYKFTLYLRGPTINNNIGNTFLPVNTF